MTKKQRGEAYLNCAMDFAEDKVMEPLGICWALTNYKIDSYNDDTSGEIYPDCNKNCPEIKLITHNKDGYEDFDEDTNLRITALLLAYEMTKD
jgi:hypothetical protein